MSLVDDLRKWAKTDAPIINARCACSVAYDSNDVKDSDVMFNWLADRIEREYLERPRFEDGEVVQIGDIVEGGYGDKMKVENFLVWSNGSSHVTDGAFSSATHGASEPYKRYVEPDTQEKINEDSIKFFVDYWNCSNIACSDCPHSGRIKELLKIDKQDIDSSFSCEMAMRLDLLRRQRELDGVE